ncbi:SMP-30/gluconolactonase/LRE family protein [Edaphobacter sp. HDX4]|uniref:SMP-30/gluconolactonase/LRE family protein n=1 Tax=Edaphobacter sp. HDX4 TaxID=2794064 RepID=UPI002FE690E1
MLRTIATIPAGFLLWLGILGTRSGGPTIERSADQSFEYPAAVERLDPAADRLIPQHPVWKQVATGFTWVEGPVWIHAGYLMFADISSNSIRKIAPDGRVSIWLQPSGYRGSQPYGGKEPGTNGMTLDPSGRLTVAGHAARNIMRFESLDPHGPVTILADHYQGKKLNSPNDLLYGSDGSLYFTDPPYGLRTQQDNDPAKELTFSGVYRLPHAVAQKPGAAPDNNALQLLIRDLPRPNGIAISPDGRWLYVSNSEPKKWMRYPLRRDGTVGTGSVFLDASQDKRPGAPDGMKIDSEGNLYAAGPGGVWIISPSGKHLATLLTDKATANVAWGGADGSTLYTTTTDSIYSIRLNAKGIRP